MSPPSLPRLSLHAAGLHPDGVPALRGRGLRSHGVAPRKLSLAGIKKTRIAVPGTLTTAYLTLKLFAPKLKP